MATLEDLLREIGQTPIPEELGQEAVERFQSGDVGGGGLFGQYSITDPSTISMLQDEARANALSNYLAQFEGRTPLDIMELNPDDEPRPSDLIGEDDVFEMLYAIMSGRQGIPEGTSEELLRELESVLAGANQDQIDAIAQQILEAGGFDAWLSQRQGNQQQELADRLAEAAEEGPGALQEALRDVLSDVGIDPTMTVEEATQKAIDFIRKVMPENTPESILEDYIGTGIGVLWEDFGNITWQQGQILIPGLPGLPIPSGMIKVGEIQDLLNDPIGAISDWSQDIWSRVLGSVTDPAAVLAGIFGGYDDIPDGLAALILSGEVTQEIINWYNNLGDDDEEEEEDTDLQSKLTEGDKDFLDTIAGELPGENPGDRDPDAPDNGGDGDDDLDTITVDEGDDDLLGETDPFEGELPGATGPFPGKDKEIEEVIGGPVGGGDDDLDTITIDDGDGEDVFEGDLPGATGPFPSKDKEIEEIIGGPVGGGDGDTDELESTLEERSKYKGFPDDEYGTDPIETDPDPDDGGDEELDPIEVTPELPVGGGGGGMLRQIEPMSFDPLGINYQPVQLQRLINPTYQDVLDQIIKRNSGMLTSPEDFLLS